MHHGPRRPHLVNFLLIMWNAYSSLGNQIYPWEMDASKTIERWREPHQNETEAAGLTQSSWHTPLSGKGKPLKAQMKLSCIIVFKTK